MLFSIIVPVYNGEKYLRDCLDSCLEQDFPASEFEIICVNDASTDGSLEILRQYEVSHKNIHVIAFSKNKGVAAARNAGIEQMQGDWCMFLDCDDFLAENCFLKAKEVLSANSDAMLCIGRLYFKECGYSRRDCIKSGWYFDCPTEQFITNRFIPSGLARQFRFLEKVQYGEDALFSLEMQLCNPTVIKLEEPLYFYRKHDDSAMSMNSMKKRLKHLNSAICLATGVRKKYGLKNPSVLQFFAGCNRIAMEEIGYLHFPKWIGQLWRMQLLRLAVWRRNDPKGRVSLSAFWDYRIGGFKNDLKQVKEEKGSFRSFLYALKNWVKIFR